MEESNMALTHEDALELLAFLITSAHGCLRESSDNGHYRLITGAERLARAWEPRSTGQISFFLRSLSTRTASEASYIDSDPDRYMNYLAECCQSIAEEIKQRNITRDGR